MSRTASWSRDGSNDGPQRLGGRTAPGPDAAARGPLRGRSKPSTASGEETRLVGGAVRDLALGEPAFDFDLATTASPDEVMRRARAAGFKVALTGVAHGTVTIIVDGTPDRDDDAARGRRDRRTPRQGGVRTRFRRRCARRDFTINALSLGPDGTVHDYCRRTRRSRRRTRALHRRRQSAHPRGLSAHPALLPLLGALRARALDAEGLAAAIRAREGLARLSRERVRAELLKLLAAPRAGEVVQTMGECGFLEPILGGLAYPGRLSRLIAIEARSRSRRPTRSCGSPRLASRSRKTPSGCANACGSPTPNTTGSTPPPRR